MSYHPLPNRDSPPQWFSWFLLALVVLLLVVATPPLITGLVREVAATAFPMPEPAASSHGTRSMWVLRDSEALESNTQLYIVPLGREEDADPFKPDSVGVHGSEMSYRRGDRVTVTTVRLKGRHGYDNAEMVLGRAP